MLALLLAHPAIASSPPPCAEAFANRVVSYVPGPGVEPDWGDPATALGAPDFFEGTGAVSLGNHTGANATIVVSFPRPIVDGKGPDLHVYEAGPSAEATELAVSVDGKTWLTVGRIEGSTRAVDLAVNPLLKGKTFAFLRLTGLGRVAAGPWAGPDIDAVGLLTCATPNS